MFSKRLTLLIGIDIFLNIFHTRSSGCLIKGNLAFDDGLAALDSVHYLIPHGTIRCLRRLCLPNFFETLGVTSAVEISDKV